MNIIILPLVLVISMIWLYAEFKLGREHVHIGLISILCTGFLIYACQVSLLRECLAS